MLHFYNLTHRNDVHICISPNTLSVTASQTAMQVREHTLRRFPESQSNKVHWVYNEVTVEQLGKRYMCVCVCVCVYLCAGVGESEITSLHSSALTLNWICLHKDGRALLFPSLCISLFSLSISYNISPLSHSNTSPAFPLFSTRFMCFPQCLSFLHVSFIAHLNNLKSLYAQQGRGL